MKEKQKQKNTQEATLEENTQTKEETELIKLKEGFSKIIEKHNLKDQKKAKASADYLTKDRRNKINVEIFARKSGLNVTEAKVFLTFILKGIKFKEEHIDKK